MVVTVLEACCLLFGFDQTWESAKRYLLNDIKFLDKLIKYNVDNAIAERFQKLEIKYLNIVDFKRESILK